MKKRKEKIKKDRTIKELLQLMLDNRIYFGSGLCWWSADLYLNDIINYDEYHYLKGYIHKYKPSKWSSLDAFLCQSSPYYWKRGNIEPRINWINKHIKLLSR